MKKIIITGANGFIGQFLVEHLIDNGYEVIALIRKGSIPRFTLKKNVEVRFADLTDQKSLRESIDFGSIVVNLAANPYDPKLSYEVNVVGTQKTD